MNYCRGLLFTISQTSQYCPVAAGLNHDIAEFVGIGQAATRGECALKLLAVGCRKRIAEPATSIF